ncbi:PREDICTED: glutathione synthetase, chloroplastic-like [Nelumbo nucifera]|uniref:Glutathione synthetase n=2 Tax=Nelumbo nucifera TaxID=4432 RepID=A0A822XJQ9_NELNU|nr:PREDICTED: glutathione synthetase, chloroplastic-like [Nelumbo nucifera]DAD19381.1 TPA_asm: hypothetical protein HUJ06_020844 [Nelumbo nucifera]
MQIDSCASSSSLYSSLSLHKQEPRSTFNFNANVFRNIPQLRCRNSSIPSLSSSFLPIKCSAGVVEKEIQDGTIRTITPGLPNIDPELLERLVHDALVWSSLHGLIVGDKRIQRSGSVPGVGMVHAPFALLPTMSFSESHWRQACELATIFNELVDRVSMDGKFLQESLSGTKKVDPFTSRLLDIHSRMQQMNKKEEVRMGLLRSDYMLDAKTNLLLQVELNTISCSFYGLSCLVGGLHRHLLNRYGEHLGLDSERVLGNNTINQYADALAKAWNEYNNPRAIVLIVGQAHERNMYDQYWLMNTLKERHDLTVIRKTMAQIDAESELRPDGTLVVEGQEVAVIYFRAGYTPKDYPSESEWRAKLLMEQSSAIKCPSVSYHLVGTKKIQQELAKPNVLERFLDNTDDITKVRKCFAGLWSLDDPSVVKNAIRNPKSFVLKPQREGGGNNIYGEDVRDALLKLDKKGSEELTSYILMQRIFPTASPAFLVLDGICHQEHAISEFGIYSAYLRNKEKVILNDDCGYLIKTKAQSSDEGGIVAGYAVSDSVYI